MLGVGSRGRRQGLKLGLRIGVGVAAADNLRFPGYPFPYKENWGWDTGRG